MLHYTGGGRGKGGEKKRGKKLSFIILNGPFGHNVTSFMYNP